MAVNFECLLVKNRRRIFDTKDKKEKIGRRKERGDATFQLYLSLP